MGQKIETLVDGIEEAGNHSVTWEVSSLSSGVYFCKFSAGSYVTTTKMNLLK